MAVLVVSFRPYTESEDTSAIHACFAKYGAVPCMSRQNLWVLQTEAPAQQVFDDFKAALRPNTPLFVGALAEAITHNLRADAEKRLADIGLDRRP